MPEMRTVWLAARYAPASAPPRGPAPESCSRYYYTAPKPCFFATISVSDAFLDKGEIVSTPGRNAEETPNASTPGRAT